MLSCKARLPKQSVPAFISDMFAQELGNLVLPMFSGRAVRFLPLSLPPVFKLSRRTLKVCHCQMIAKCFTMRWRRSIARRLCMPRV